jgi:hypothetical protein
MLDGSIRSTAPLARSNRVSTSLDTTTDDLTPTSLDAAELHCGHGPHRRRHQPAASGHVGWRAGAHARHRDPRRGGRDDPADLEAPATRRHRPRRRLREHRRDRRVVRCGDRCPRARQDRRRARQPDLVHPRDPRGHADRDRHAGDARAAHPAVGRRDPRRQAPDHRDRARASARRRAGDDIVAA